MLRPRSGLPLRGPLTGAGCRAGAPSLVPSPVPGEGRFCLIRLTPNQAEEMLGVFLVC